MASPNCNIFASATIVTWAIGVAHPSFILLLVCVVVLCQTFFSNNHSPLAHPGRTRGDYPPCHPMNYMSLYADFYASYDVELLRMRKAYGLYKL